MFMSGESVYKERFDDDLGVYFDEATFPGLSEAISKGDVSDFLQEAILALVKAQQYGILYIPEGEYPIAKTVMIPKAVRIIGYGKNRPVFVLSKDVEGFEREVDTSHMPGWGEELNADYMLWFIGNYGAFEPKKTETIQDANPGTFYSALSNIDFRIEGHHPSAVCIRAHFAQHCFVSHCSFNLGSGLAAIYDVGNEMEDLYVEGGKYGLLCRMTSPGWPFALFDSHFVGQQCAAFMTSQNGFTGIRLSVSDTDKVFESWDKTTWEKLYLENCKFENIKDCVITCTESGNVGQQINIRNISCENVNDLVRHVDINNSLNLGNDFILSHYTCGYELNDDGNAPDFTEKYETKPLDKGEAERMLLSDIPGLGEMKEWVSVKAHGAVGDGKSDDTKAIQKAIDESAILYFPQGIYRITDSLIVNKNITIIGMHPATTQIVILDDEEAFMGFGEPKALINVCDDTRVIINGIGIDTASKNPRACGVLWAASESSYMNDVKFMGGHGMMYRDGRNPFETLYNPSRTADFYPEKIWDYQYASLWILGGGGIFKDVWSCSPYAEAGIAVTDTARKCNMYAISLEHHVRHEIKINNVKNLKIYALQTEEEKAEGTNCLPMEIISSENVEIINYYLFRVVSVDEPYDTGIRLWNSKNIRFTNLRNMAQMQYTFTVNLIDETTGFVAKSSDYASLYISGSVNRKPERVVGDYRELASGFSFAQGATLDNSGNLFWCDKKKKTVYCYDVKKDVTYPLIDIHYTPCAVAFDTIGNMIVTVDFSELKKEAKPNPFEDHNRLDPHPFFSWFYKRGEKVYSIDKEHPYSSMKQLKKVSVDEITDLDKRPVIRCIELDYPGSFELVTGRKLEEYYVAADDVTLIEGTKDLARSLGLRMICVGDETTVTDDFLRKTHLFKVLEGGNYKEVSIVANRGQYGAALDVNQVYWVVEDRIYGFMDGQIVASMDAPWDAHSLRIGDDAMYVIGRKSIWKRILERI